MKKIFFWNDYLVILTSNALYFHPAYSLDTMSEMVTVEGDLGGIPFDERLSLPEPIYDALIADNTLILAADRRIYLVPAIDTYDLSDFSTIDLVGGDAEIIESLEHDFLWRPWCGECLEYDEGIYLNRIRAVWANGKGDDLTLYIADKTGLKSVRRTMVGAWERVGTIEGFGPSESLFSVGDRIYFNDWFTTTEVGFSTTGELWPVSVTPKGSNGTYAVNNGRLFMGGWGRVKAYAVEKIVENQLTLTLPRQEISEPFRHLWFAPMTTWSETAVVSVRPVGVSEWMTMKAGEIVSLSQEANAFDARITMARDGDKVALMETAIFVTMSDYDLALVTDLIAKHIPPIFSDEAGQVVRDVNRSYGGPNDRAALGSIKISRKDLLWEKIPSVPTWDP